MNETGSTEQTCYSPRPKVIFFDAVGTLFHLPRGVGFHYHDVLARHGVLVPEEALASAFTACWAGMPPFHPAGNAPADDGKSWWRELVRRVVRRCGVAEDELDFDTFFEELYSEFVRPAVWSLYPEAEAVLEALADQFHLGVITNFDGRYRAVAEQLGIARFFRTVVISSEVGAEKPSPQIFQHALALAGVAAKEALHVGDDPVSDWKGATAAGLHVFRLDRARNDLRSLLPALDCDPKLPEDRDAAATAW
jgi:putative hydrolase of the HAD superfamily